VPDDASDEVLIAMSTFPSPGQAADAARALVEEKLAACVNLVPSVRSIYSWKGTISDDTETLAIIKTTRAQLFALTARLVALHPYEVPELVALPISGGHAPYLAWIGDTIR
jgi:periplasmic divalent cation tolerance protein